VSSTDFFIIKLAKPRRRRWASPENHYTTPYAILSIGKLHKVLIKKYPKIGQNFFQKRLTFRAHGGILKSSKRGTQERRLKQ